MNNLGDQATFVVTAMAHVEETGQVFTNTETLTFAMPTVTIEVVFTIYSI